jgi:hypothetical protein
MAVEIKITDDGTRLALRFAVWDRVHNAVGDGTIEFYDLSRAALGATDPDEIEVLGIVVDAARDAQRIIDAKAGEEITLSIPHDALMRGLDGCLSYLREDQSFWDAGPEERDLRLEIFDAADRLSRVLTPAEVA